MNEEVLLEIINGIKNFIDRKQILAAKEYIELEIDNLTGKTEENCKNNKYHFYPTYCKYCSNSNCSSNRKNENIC